MSCRAFALQDDAAAADDATCRRYADAAMSPLPRYADARYAPDVAVAIDAPRLLPCRYAADYAIAIIDAAMTCRASASAAAAAERHVLRAAAAAMSADVHYPPHAATFRRAADAA